MSEKTGMLNKKTSSHPTLGAKASEEDGSGESEDYNIGSSESFDSEKGVASYAAFINRLDDVSGNSNF